MADVNALKLEEQINKAIRDRSAMLQAQTRELQSQLQLSLQMKTLVDGIKPEEATERLNATQQMLEQVAEKAKTAGTSGSEALAAIEQGAQKASNASVRLQLQTKLLAAKFPMLKNVGMAALTGLAQGFTNLLSLGKGFAGALEGVLGFVFDLGKAILSIPLSIFGKLVDLAGSFTGDNSLAQAFEDLRKDFGSFKEDVSKNVIGSFHEIQKGLTGTGLSAFRVLGTFAEQLKYFHEIAKGAGAGMHQFGEEIKSNAGLIAGLDKGLGVGADNIKSYMDLATVKGQSLNKTMLDTANYSLQMGNAFGMSQKVLAKDITMMVKDVRNFGSMTQKEMSVASVYTRKLGIEVKSLLGLIDKFDTFEDAANSAAMLSQTFGGAVDAFRLMNEQDPAKRMDMLRQAMSAAGKTTENMSRQELKLLEQTTGLDAATAKLAFSSKNQGLTYDQVQKQAEKAEKKQLSQAEAMSKLADSIERMIKSGETMKGGFLAQFLEGFERGIKWSKPFLDVMMNIRRALWDTMMAGRQVGQMFVETFPGVNKLLTSFAGMFSKEKFSGLLTGVVGSFRDFFKEASEGKYSLKNLIEKLRKNFFDYFDSNSANGREFLESGKTFLKAMAGIIGDGIKFVVETLTSGAKHLAEFITNPAEFLAKMKGGAGGALSGAMEILQPLIDALGDKKLWTELYGAFSKLFEVVFDKVVDWFKGPTFRGIVAKSWPVLALVLFGPALTRTMAAVFLESIAKVFLGDSGKQIQAAMQKGGEKLARGAGKSASVGDVSKNLSKSVPNAESMNVTKVFVKQASSINVKTIVTAGLVVAALATLFYVGMPPLLNALAESAKSFEKVSPDAVTSMLKTLAVVSGSLVAFSITAAVISKLKVDPVSATVGLLGVSVVVAAMAGTVIGMAYAMKGLSPTLVESVGKTMLYMSGAFMGASVVVLAATAIGSLFVGSAGIGAGVALAGLAGIAVVVGAMAESVIEILKVLNKTPLGPEISEKTKAFSNVMDSISKFGEMMAKMIAATTPSWVELLGGQGNTLESLKQLNVFVDNFIGASNGGGITSIINLIRRAVEEFKSEAVMKGAEVFASTLGAVSSLAASLVPTSEMKSGFDSFMNMLRGENSDTQLVDVTNYVKRFVDQISTFMGVIMGTLGKLTTLNVSDQALKSVQAFAAVSSATASMIKALVPTPEFLKSLKNTEALGSIAGADVGKLEYLQPEKLTAVGNFMQRLFAGVGPLVEVLTGTALKNVIAQANTIDEKSLEKIKVVGSILTTVASLMGSLSDMTSKGGAELSSVTDGAKISKVIKTFPSLGSVLKDVETHIPLILTSVLNATKSIPNDTSFVSKIDTIKKMFETVGALSAAFKGIAGIGADTNWNAVRDGIGSSAVALNTIFFDTRGFGGTQAGEGVMPALVNKIRYISQHSKELLLTSAELNTFDTIKKTADGVSSVARALTNLQAAAIEMKGVNFSEAIGKNAMGITGGEKVAPFVKGIAQFAGDLQKVAGDMGAKGIIPSLKAVEDTIKSINALNAVLASGDAAKIKITESLKKFVDNSGLGKSGSYTIQNKGIVVNVHMEVKMNAAEVEEAIVLRKDSIIRDGIKEAATLSEEQHNKLNHHF